MDIEFMIKNILLALLISSQAFAGLPPPTVKSQSDSTAKTIFQIQAPHNQFTDLGGVKTLIETGNGNILPDPGFEALTSGWTASGGATATANSTAKGTGALGYDWDSNSAAQTLQSTSVTIPAGLAGKNGIASCNIKTVSGTATHTFTVNDGTNDIVTPITIQSSTAAFLGSNEGNKINFVFPTSGTIRIKLAAVNANEPEIYIDDCSIQLANNVYDAPLVTAWTAYTPTFTGFGTATSVQFQYRRNGSDLEVRGKFTSGTSTATEARVSFPTGLTSSGTSVIPSIRLCGDQVRDTNASIYFRDSILCEPSVSYATFGKQTDTDNALTKQLGTGMALSGRVLSLSFSVPISGWAAVSAVSSDQTDYDWTSYTPTFTGFGTVTSPECQHSRVASNLLLRCKFTSGTPTAVEARVSLLNSLVSADTNKTPSLQSVGILVQGSNNGALSTYTLIEPSVSYVTFGLQNLANSGLVKSNGSTFSTSSNPMSLTATIPIQGWSSNQRAPTLVGSVTSNATGAERIERAFVSATCSSSPCTIASGNSGNWLTNITRTSAGTYSANFASGVFSSAPSCTVWNHETNRHMISGGAPTTSAWVFQTNLNADSGFNLICMGPR